jgi:hypothetical protein
MTGSSLRLVRAGTDAVDPLCHQCNASRGCNTAPPREPKTALYFAGVTSVTLLRVQPKRSLSQVDGLDLGVGS